MRPHVKNYYNAFGYDESSFVPCEVCGRPSNDIHHIEPRSKFGSKNYGLMDSVQNLIALCRQHHTEAHGVNSRDIKLQLKEIVSKRKIVTAAEWNGEYWQTRINAAYCCGGETAKKTLRMGSTD